MHAYDPASWSKYNHAIMHAWKISYQFSHEKLERWLCSLHLRLQVL